MIEIISAVMVCVGFFERLFSITKSTMKILNFSVIKLSVITVVTLGSTLSLSDNFGYAVFLKIQNKYNEFKLKSEITQVSQQLDEVYKKIGQGVYNKEQEDYLTNLAQQYNQDLTIKKKQITASEETVKKKILLEQSLKDLTADEAKVRMSAIENLYEIGDRKFLPYLAMALSDTDEQVRRRVMIVIENMEGKDAGN